MTILANLWVASLLLSASYAETSLEGRVAGKPVVVVAASADPITARLDEEFVKEVRWVVDSWEVAVRSPPGTGAERPIAAQVEELRALLASEHADAVVWLAPHDQNVSMFLLTGWQTSSMVRTVEAGLRPGWASELALALREHLAAVFELQRQEDVREPLVRREAASSPPTENVEASGWGIRAAAEAARGTVAGRGPSLQFGVQGAIGRLASSSQAGLVFFGNARGGPWALGGETRIEALAFAAGGEVSWSPAFEPAGIALAVGFAPEWQGIRIHQGQWKADYHAWGLAIHGALRFCGPESWPWTAELFGRGHSHTMAIRRVSTGSALVATSWLDLGLAVGWQWR